MKYETVIGLEVHAELSTESKMYCSCRNEFGGEANTRCCPVCSGMPGALPVLNERAVEYATRMGCALHCRISPASEMARKNYFYPDLPKAYQISQSEHPLCEKGWLEIETGEGIRRIGVARLHMEEDAGKLIHDEALSATLVDLNRCGVPLIEIVTEPDLRSAEEAGIFLETVKSYLDYLDISDCRMEEGSIRCDVNVSLRPAGSGEFGVRCEMKNVNSFSGVMRAIEYESKRQSAVLERGESISRETRRWDDRQGISIPMRKKEAEQDYRYFPEPDLPPVRLEEGFMEKVRRSLPELPDQKKKRYVEQYGLTPEEAVQLISEKGKSALFEELLSLGKISPQLACNWILGEISRRANQGLKVAVSAGRLFGLLSMIEEGKLSHAQAKTVLDSMWESGKEAAEIVRENGLELVSDGDVLRAAVERVLGKNVQAAADYRAGKSNALGYLLGQCMKETKGQGNPTKMKEILQLFLEQA